MFLTQRKKKIFRRNFFCFSLACIGCTSWLKCCDHDVFGNCVKCPGWKACCWHGKSPICKGKNHACRIMKQVAAENLQKIAVSTVFSRLNAAALFKFSKLQMRHSFRGGGQSGAALFKKSFICELYNKNFYQ